MAGSPVEWDVAEDTPWLMTEGGMTMKGKQYFAIDRQNVF